ncbi:MAG: hypothetical protein KJP10_05565, partial [Gammaproteobacteria bacterium]|nr:hypothetical protein [Gammaproteobacteria bacterium]
VGFSPVEPGRRVRTARGKGECRGNPKGKLAVGAISFGYFALGMQRKVTRPAGRNQMLEQARNKRIDNN